MIVRPSESGCLLITQPDHAHLARRIMEHCVLLVGNPRREAILIAVGEHDAGWTEVDANPEVDPATGNVVDFITAPLAIRQGVWPRTVAGLAAEPYAAALVAHHASFVYDRYRADAAWAAFFDGMEKSRSEMLAASGASLEQLQADYLFVRLGDLISLAFCTGSTTAQTYREWTVQLSGPRVVVTPGIFGGAPVPFEVEARAVRPPFGSNAELQEALSRSATAMIQGEAA
jgi:hypothetical protein